MNALPRSIHSSAGTCSYIVATAALLVFLQSAGAGEQEGGRFTVRCLNKDSVVRPEADGKVNIQLEVALSLRQDLKLKPGDLRLAILDVKLLQLDELAIVVPSEWTKKSFKKGENKETLTLQFPAPGDLKAGQEYYVAVVIAGTGGEGVFPAALRLVKFKVMQDGIPKKDAPADLKKLGQARVEAANKGHNLAIRTLQAGGLGVRAEDVGAWSVRLLNAQRNLSTKKADRIYALDDHLQRMQDLARKVEVMRKAGVGSSLDTSTADYYLREAELWLAQEKSTAKQGGK